MSFFSVKFYQPADLNGWGRGLNWLETVSPEHHLFKLHELQLVPLNVQSKEVRKAVEAERSGFAVLTRVIDGMSDFNFGILDGHHLWSNIDHLPFLLPLFTKSFVNLNIDDRLFINGFEDRYFLGPGDNQSDEAVERCRRLGDIERLDVREECGVLNATNLHTKAARTRNGLGGDCDRDLARSLDRSLVTLSIDDERAVFGDLLSTRGQLECFSPGENSFRAEADELNGRGRRRWRRWRPRARGRRRRRGSWRRVDKDVAARAAIRGQLVGHRSDIERLRDNRSRGDIPSSGGGRPGGHLWAGRGRNGRDRRRGPTRGGWLRIEGKKKVENNPPPPKEGTEEHLLAGLRRLLCGIRR